MPGENVGAWLTGLAGKYEVLAAAGGDGTVSTVASAALAGGRTLGVLPVGTLNHFARDTGIPTDLQDAVAVLGGGHTTLVDVGLANDSVFLNNASLGAYPRMVLERTRARESGWPRPIASAKAIGATWLELRNTRFRIRVDGREMVRRSPLVVIGNGEYEVEGLRVGARRTVSDAALSLYVAPRTTRRDALMLPCRVLLGRLKQDPDFEILQASSIVVDLGRPVTIALDGEVTMMQNPVEFRVKPRALKVLVPPPKEG
jgi:diacylglycerol kinase family enzyme